MIVTPLKDHISSVELTNHMGSDLDVVNAARVSFAKEHKQFNNDDAKLIKYLSEHGHWSPFAHPQISFRIKMPIFVAREWYRHTIGFTRNEISRRYVNNSPEFYQPTKLRLKHENKKQGSSEETTTAGVDAANAITAEVANLYDAMIELYHIAPEQARMYLPQSMYTEFIETGSLYAYARLCNLRLQSDAQQETKQYAEAVSELIAPLFPVSWEALCGS